MLDFNAKMHQGRSQEFHLRGSFQFQFKFKYGITQHHFDSIARLRKSWRYNTLLFWCILGIVLHLFECLHDEEFPDPCYIVK